MPRVEPHTHGHDTFCSIDGCAGDVVEIPQEVHVTYEELPVGSVVATHWGNQFRKFKDGWSPLNGAHWDRWTVNTDRQMTLNYPYAVVKPRKRRGP
jgi:hypothetical protein